MSGSSDKTEAPTPRRLQRAREEGNVPVSHEVGPAIALAGTAVLLRVIGPAGFAPARLGGLLRHAIGPDSDLFLHAAPAAALICAVTLLGPILLLALFAAVAPVLLQTGFLLHPGALVPDLSRIGLGRGLARVFGPHSLFAVLRGLAKLLAFCLLAWRNLGPAIATLPAMAKADLPAALASGFHLVSTALLLAALVQGVGAGVDIFLSYRRHQSGLRMSREDIRQESRETNGNPEIKARIRRLRAQRARRRLAQSVQRATVVVTNPTHYAVALDYDPASRAAPRVVAKGMDEMAARIRALAAEHKVPLVANPPLARALHRVEIDAEIPPELYKAVAELIAYVWRLQGKARG